MEALLRVNIVSTAMLLYSHIAPAWQLWGAPSSSSGQDVSNNESARRRDMHQAKQHTALSLQLYHISNMHIHTRCIKNMTNTHANVQKSRPVTHTNLVLHFLVIQAGLIHAGLGLCSPSLILFLSETLRRVCVPVRTLLHHFSIQQRFAVWSRSITVSVHLT